MNYHIRVIKPEDEQPFISLYHQYCQEYQSIERLYPIQYDSSIGLVMWKMLTEEPKRYLAVVAEHEETCVGFCTGEVYHFDEIEKRYYEGTIRGDAWDLYTAQEWRGKGIGAALLQGLEKEFAAHGCEHMILNNVDYANTSARKLYESIGYAPWSVKYYKKISR